MTAESLNVSDMRGHFEEPVPGWDGDLVDGWRIEGCTYWWNVLHAPADSTPRDWIDPWLDRTQILQSRASWTRLWLYEASLEMLPLHWLRSAMTYVQMVRRVTPGTPVDNQIGTYLPFVDHFFTGDRGFLSAVEHIRAESPLGLAHGHLLLATRSALEQLDALTQKLAPRHSES